MAEISPGSALEKITNRKKFISELIFVGIFFAIQINIFSTCLQNLVFNPDQDFEKWMLGALVSGGCILLTMIIAVFFVLFKKETETMNFAVTLPILIDPDGKTAAIVSNKNYQFSHEAEKLFSKAKKEIAGPFFDNWKENTPLTGKGQYPGNYCYDMIMNLMEASVVVLLKNFGDRALTHSAMFYREFRSLAGKIPPCKLPVEKWPDPLRNNPFLKARNIQKLLIPDGAKLTHSKPQGQKPDNPPAHLIKISAEYVSFAISISPYWTIPRDKKSCRERFGTADNEKVVFLRIPLDVSMELRGGFFSFKGIYWDKRELNFQYTWGKKLKNNAFRRMDWGYFLGSEKD